MIKTTPDSPAVSLDAPVLDPSIVERALSHYLPTPRTSVASPAGDAADVEAVLLHALEFLNCAAATSAELGESLNGAQRSLAFSAMHMTEMAKVMVERSLESVEQR